MKLLPSVILKTAQKDLRLKELPQYIECFDNSNLQGSNAVASLLFLKTRFHQNAITAISILRQLEGPNDFASMEEIVFRKVQTVARRGTALAKFGDC